MTGTFVKSYLGIAKAEFISPASADAEFSIREASAEQHFQTYIDRVGGPWGWNRRPTYARELSSLFNRLRQPQTKFYQLLHGVEVVGYCMVTKPPAGSAGSLTLNRINDDQLLEIENFGLFPEYNGKGYGRHFLPLIFEKTFKDADYIFLSTRSTNHPRVVPFYLAQGMKILKQETLPDDLLPQPINDNLPTEGGAAPQKAQKSGGFIAPK